MSKVEEKNEKVNKRGYKKNWYESKNYLDDFNRGRFMDKLEKSHPVRNVVSEFRIANCVVGQL